MICQFSFVDAPFPQIWILRNIVLFFSRLFVGLLDYVSVMAVSYVFLRYFCVDHRGTDPRMTEEFLQIRHVHAVVYRICSCGVPDQMRK